MMSGRTVFGAGDARQFPSMENRYLQKICSRHPGFADLSDTPAPNTIRPDITRHAFRASTGLFLARQIERRHAPSTSHRGLSRETRVADAAATRRGSQKKSAHGCTRRSHGRLYWSARADFLEAAIYRECRIAGVPGAAIHTPDVRVNFKRRFTKNLVNRNIARRKVEEYGCHW